MADLKLAKRIVNLREQIDMSQSELARRMNIDKSTMNKIESGSRKVSSDELRAFSKLFDVSTDYLLGNTDKKHYYDLTEKDYRGIDKQIEDMMNGVSKNSLSYFQNGAALDEDDKKLLAASLRQVLETSRVLAKKKFTPRKFRDSNDE
ncbi:helix-turn-helix domain-containing protein [Lactobacillus curvatus]|nr:helix-turn-helix domain-containing protein [Latilactobacillus curvatus]MSE22957.1 helix-turn-helix domain-containing protein [Latilactobacillus curvatus]